MAKDLVCALCGREFNIAATRAVFNEKHAGRFDYDKKSFGKMCLACSCYMVDSLRWCSEDARGGSSHVRAGCLSCGGDFPSYMERCPAADDR